jgi:hypothetical protein
MPMATTATRDLAVMGEFPGVFRVGMCGRVAIAAWFGSLSIESVEAYARVVQDVIARLGGGRGSVVHLVNERVGMPPSATRPALTKLMEDTQALSCASVVVQGSGFWASAIRGFLTGMRLLGPSTYRIREHSTLADVVAWLPAEHEKFTGEPLDPEELARCLEIAKRWQVG